MSEFETKVIALLERIDRNVATLLREQQAAEGRKRLESMLDRTQPKPSSAADHVAPQRRR